MITWLSLCVGAVAGATLRWQLGLWLAAARPTDIPWGTVWANLSGAWLIGVLFMVFQQAEGLNPALRVALITGFLGALTTFSTFSLETLRMLQAGAVGVAASYTLLSLGGSLLLTYLGMRMATWATN